MTEHITFYEAVAVLMTAQVTSPGYVIVGGLVGNEGVAIARDFDTTNHTRWLGQDEWYVVQTNRDVMTYNDPRYNSAIRYMDVLGQDAVELDGREIIENVLWQQGVLQADTIFSSTQTATSP